MISLVCLHTCWQKLIHLDRFDHIFSVKPHTQPSWRLLVRDLVAIKGECKGCSQMLAVRLQHWPERRLEPGPERLELSDENDFALLRFRRRSSWKPPLGRGLHRKLRYIGGRGLAAGADLRAEAVWLNSWFIRSLIFEPHVPNPCMLSRRA